MISARRLTTVHGQTTVLDDVSLDVRAGECVWLCGDSGSGKTTLLRVLAGLDQPRSGSIHLRGNEHPADSIKLRRTVMYVAGNAIVGTGLRVDEYLRFMTAMRPVRGSFDPSKVADIARHAGLSPAAAVATLTSRERAAVAIATALATRADVLLIDEAIDAIAPEHRESVISWLAAERELGAAILIATNDAELQNALCGRVIRLQDGHLVEHRGPAALTPDSTPTRGRRPVGAL